MLVDVVPVATGGIRLPHLDERVGDRASVLVEHTAVDDDPLAEGIGLMLARQVAVVLQDRILAEDGPLQRV
jgi:hypothetical protein